MFQYPQIIPKLRPFGYSFLLPKRQSLVLFWTQWNGFHLPCAFRVNYHTFIYTRCAVPIDCEQSRMFYFRATRPGSGWQHWMDTLVFSIWRNWQMHYHFSG